MKNLNENPRWFKGILKPLMIGLLFGGVACLAALLAMAWTATMWSIPHAYIVPLGVVAAVFGAWFGGFVGAKSAGRNGWMMGLIISLLLFVVSILAGLGLYQTLNTAFLLIKCLLMLACGMLGGIMAVNTGKRTARHTH